MPSGLERWDPLAAMVSIQSRGCATFIVLAAALAGGVARANETDYTIVQYSGYDVKKPRSVAGVEFYINKTSMGRGLIGFRRVAKVLKTKHQKSLLVFARVTPKEYEDDDKVFLGPFLTDKTMVDIYQGVMAQHKGLVLVADRVVESPPHPNDAPASVVVIDWKQRDAATIARNGEVIGRKYNEQDLEESLAAYFRAFREPRGKMESNVFVVEIIRVTPALQAVNRTNERTIARLARVNRVKLSSLVIDIDFIRDLNRLPKANTSRQQD